MKNNNYDVDRSNFLRESEHLLRQNNLVEALDLSIERLSHFPVDADALAVGCEALIGMGRINELRELLNQVAGFISGLNLIYERAGDVCRENGFHQEAAACYENYLSLRPDTEKAGEIIGKMALLEQQDSRSADVNDVEDNSGPEKNFFTVTMAQLYIKQGHVQDAEIILEEIIKKEPDNGQALSMLDKIRASRISQPEDEKEPFNRANLINILSSWLKNIERLKLNAAAKSRV
jgi:tetratricopeptide (TPR) repeat protein